MSVTPDLPDDVARFVAEVRSHLDDLSPGSARSSWG